AAILGFDEAGIPITVEDTAQVLKSIVSKSDQEFVYHPAVAKRVEEFMGNVINDDATNDLLKNYDKLQNLWKASVTSMFPAFHGRNAISNVFLHMMDIGVHSLDPRLHALTVNLSVKSRKMNRLLTRMEGVGDVSVSKELGPLAKEARKFDTAEEFVKAQPKLFHGTQIKETTEQLKPRRIFNIEKKGIFLSSSLEEASISGKVKSFSLSPDTKLKQIDVVSDSVASEKVLDKQINKAISEGFEAVRYKNVSIEGVESIHTIVFDTQKILTKSQLTDIFNKVKRTSPLKGLEAEARITDIFERVKKAPEGDATKALDEYTKLLDTQVFEDATGYNWKFGELHQVITQHNIAFTRRITSNIDITRKPEEAIDALWGATTARGKAAKFLPTGQKFIGFRAGRGIGTAIEEQARLVDFVANLRATGDVNLAAIRTKQFLFDYANLTNFEKHVMRRIIPFYTFTRKNLEVQARALMTTPGRSVAQIHALTNLGEVLSGAELTKEERDALPDWIKSGVEILKSKRGETVEILGSLGTPLEQPFQAFQPNNFLGSISPILRVPVEQASGYSFFHGKALSDVTNAAAFKNFPEIIKNFIGFTEIKGNRSDGTPFVWYTSLRPERMHILLNLPPTSRVLTSLKQIQAADVSGQSKILQQLVGLRPFSFDLEQEATKRERELKEKLEKLLINAGVVAKFSRTFIPKD
ncbi:MAG: hypothetical protein QQN63_05495, partial [Nitrosopumilus sp.]